MRWYRAAAEQGLAPAQSLLGFMYRAGNGVAKNDAVAAKWLLAAAEQDHAWGQFGIGRMYERGAGVELDPEEAVQWYRKAAAQGLEPAEEALLRLGQPATTSQ